MHDKKLTMLEFPIPLEIFFIKYNIHPDEYALAKLLEGIMELGNKLTYDINNPIDSNSINELINYTGIFNNLPSINEYILTEFTNTIFTCVYDLLAKMAVHDLLGSVKYVIGVNSYQLAVETYKI